MLVLGSALRAAIPLPPMKPPLKPSSSQRRASMMLSTTGSIIGLPPAIAARNRAPLLAVAGCVPPGRAWASAVAGSTASPTRPPATSPAPTRNPRLLWSSIAMVFSLLTAAAGRMIPAPVRAITAPVWRLPVASLVAAALVGAPLIAADGDRRLIDTVRAQDASQVRALLGDKIDVN